MGCNESKHDAVATGNTILRRKQSDDVKSTRDIETVKENPTARNTADEHHARDVVGHANDVGSTVIEKRDLDDHHQRKESTEEDHQEIDQGDDHHERLISRDSPNHFFSSRKDEEAILGNNIDGIISEGRSGKSEYNTPRHKDDDHVIKADQNVNVVDDHDQKEVAGDHDQDQSNPEEKNGKPENLEENAELKEEEPPKTEAETEVSGPVKEEKNTTPNEEEKQHVAHSPPEELKTV